MPKPVAPKPADLGSGAARKAADKIVDRKERNRQAMCEAQAAMGIKDPRCQSTDHMNSR